MGKRKEIPVYTGDEYKIRQVFYKESIVKFLYKIPGGRTVSFHECGSIFNAETNHDMRFTGGVLDLYIKAHWGWNTFTKKDNWSSRRSWEARVWW